jgi:predicted NUDIX family phosphoesterase
MAVLENKYRALEQEHVFLTNKLLTYDFETRLENKSYLRLAGHLSTVEGKLDGYLKLLLSRGHTNPDDRVYDKLK